MTTAFVLSGGASLGSIQVGMLEALYERDIRPDLIVGTSAGALNGAFIADRPQVVQTALALGDVWRGLSRGQVFPVSPVTGALGLIGARSHLVPDSGLRRLIGRHTTAERLEDTLVPLHVIATDVLRGEEVRLSEGPMVDAVMASAAIPGVLPAVDWAGRELIDGGVANNAPLTHALELGADGLIEQARADARLFLDARASGCSGARGRRPRTHDPLHRSAPSLAPGGSAPRSRGSGCPGAARTDAGAASSPQSSAGPTSA
jgi:predicted acylesterase/phospholipase RssA